MISTKNIIKCSVEYLRDNKFNHAIALLKESIIIYPHNADIYNHLCVAYGLVKNYTDTVSARLMSVQVAPYYQLAKNNILWVEHGKWEKQEVLTCCAT